MNLDEQERERALSIKAAAERLGFDACRIASAADAADDGFDGWLARGCHADMAWLARSRDLRRQPALKLPGARSVVVLARYYFRRDLRPAPGAAIARYAWSRDYHRALARPLAALAAHIRTLAPEAACYASTDSGPVRERAWAARSGLGWVGRHGLIIHPRFGSWTVLATVITTLALLPDAPMPDRCGDCDACVRACPTGAIIEGRLVDARRCIAYHTVEHKGPLPDAMAGRLNGWVFGCDRCQEACPWSHPERLPEDADIAIRHDFADLDARQILAMSDADFRARFAGTPVLRAKRAGLQRNAESGRTG